MLVTWEAAGVIIAAFMGISGAQLFILRLLIKDAVKDAAAALIDRSDSTYVKREVCNVIQKEYDRRLDELQGITD